MIIVTVIGSREDLSKSHSSVLKHINAKQENTFLKNIEDKHFLCRILLTRWSDERAGELPSH